MTKNNILAVLLTQKFGFTMYGIKNRLLNDMSRSNFASVVANASLKHESDTESILTIPFDDGDMSLIVTWKKSETFDNQWVLVKFENNVILDV